MSKQTWDSVSSSTRKNLYQLVREYLYQLMFHSTLVSNKAEEKGLWVIYGLLGFVQGNHRFPHSDELRDLISDILDRNLGMDEISKKYKFSNLDSLADLTESELLDRLESLYKLQEYQKEWQGWQDGK